MDRLWAGVYVRRVAKVHGLSAAQDRAIRFDGSIAARRRGHRLILDWPSRLERSLRGRALLVGIEDLKRRIGSLPK